LGGGLLFFLLFSVPSYAQIRLSPLAGRWTGPVGLFHAGDGSGRLFIVEQAGVIRTWKEGKISTFLDVRDRVASGGETGLLGLAFHPKFAQNGRFFVNYTSKTGGLHTVISEWRVDHALREVNRKSERILLAIPQPYANHNGGQIVFGLDGHLYIGMGDGGSANDPHGHGQNRATLLGKMLRIDVNRQDKGRPYAIPPDNPFVGVPKNAPEIWALGLRNPWRFSFDRASGFLYAGDVGQSAREEIDVIRKGENYGWKVMEGTICTPGVGEKCDRQGLTPPIFDYPRSDGTVVIGGYVYRGRAIPMLFGRYIYGDFGNGKIWALQYDGKQVRGWFQLLSTGRNISAFGEDEAGEMYVVDYNGTILKMVGSGQK
jgi:glucose/arabinose dehydrogenase